MTDTNSTVNQIATNPYEWLDIAQLIEDAMFVTSAREALKMERLAWERCNAHRQALEAQLKTQ
jgi:hypothetical protein